MRSTAPWVAFRAILLESENQIADWSEGQQSWRQVPRARVRAGMHVW